MGNRHRSRELALQALYQYSSQATDPEESMEALLARKRVSADTIEYTKKLVDGAKERLERIDSLIRAACDNWRLERILSVDLVIIRLATFEMLTEAAPAAVAIDEALRLAKRFSSAESSSFINGVLDKIKQLIQEEAEVRPGDPEAAL